ncbi:hypothetical protein BGZ83_007076 [Gryganskiella cystojenkinii]|nr:hypothetical protein BGZ83_007076 [Gryganskiella cystojenkinii]
MLRQKVSYSSHTTPEQSPSPSPIPGSRSSSSASNHHRHHSLFHDSSSASGVRKAFSHLQNALHPSRNNHSQQLKHQQSSSETRHANGMPDLKYDTYHHHQFNGNGNSNGSVVLNDRLRPQYSHKYSSDPSTASILAHSTYSAHSNGTTDSFFSSSSTMSPLTTDDDNSSITSQSRQPQRPRQVLKASSLPSPLGAYSHANGSSEHTSATGHTVRQVTMDRARQSPAPTTSSSGTVKSGSTESGLKPPLQLRVRNFDRSAVNTGYLTKFSSRTFFARKQWKRRYFILTHKSLHCFKSADPQHPLLESLPLSADTIVCVTDIFSGKRYCLQITSPNEKEWFVLADTASEMAVWLRALKGTVLRYRNLQIDPSTRPTAGLSDLSSMVSLDRPYSPALTTTEDSNIPQRPSSPPPRPPHPSQFYADLYSSSTMTMSMTSPSLSPPPRAVSKPSTPIPGAGPHSSYDQEQQQPQLGTRRRANSAFATTSAQPTTDYASFGTVMERAEVLSNEEGRQHHHYSALPLPNTHTYGRRSSIIDMYDDHDGDYSSENTDAAVSRTNSFGNSSISGGSTVHSRRTSIISDRPDSGMASTLPRRSSQRLMAGGSSSRPISPVSRPLSPSQMNRSSPRNSLVIAPPPRSVHRPASISVRNSTMPMPLQNAPGLTALVARSLSPTPEDNDDGSEGALSRITSIRHTRDAMPVRQRHVSLGNPGEQERTFRSPSRSGTVADFMAAQSASASFGPPPERPLSPAPTQPLPDVPGSAVLLNAASHYRSSLLAQQQLVNTANGRRIQIVPRHHDPELLLNNTQRPSSSSTTSKARLRTQSQESPLSSMAHDTQFTVCDNHNANRAATPSPRLAAVATGHVSNSAEGQGSAPSSPSMSPSRTSLSKHISLPLNSRLILPAPPSGQQPDIPVAATMVTAAPTLVSATISNSTTTTPNSSRPTSTHRYQHHKHSVSTSSMSSQSSIGSFAAGITTASLGGPVPRKHHNSARESTLSSRLSCLAPLPPGAAASVPSPPTSALPPTPVSNVVSKAVKMSAAASNVDIANNGAISAVVMENLSVAAMTPLPPSPEQPDSATFDNTTTVETQSVVTDIQDNDRTTPEAEETARFIQETVPDKVTEQEVMNFELILEEQEESESDLDPIEAPPVVVGIIEVKAEGEQEIELQFLGVVEDEAVEEEVRVKAEELQFLNVVEGTEEEDEGLKSQRAEAKTKI